MKKKKTDPAPGASLRSLGGFCNPRRLLSLCKGGRCGSSCRSCTPRRLSAGPLALCLLLAGLLAAGCTREKFISLDEQVRKEYRLAVVLPLAGEMENHWRRSIDWALDNLAGPLAARQGIRITAEWYDEESNDIESLFTTLASREDLAAIIGPLYSDNAQVAARCCAATDKPLLPALASSELLMRTYAAKGFLWCLTENDISQCEILLTLAARQGAKSVSLLTPANLYGQTFLDWFAFQAKELRLEAHRLETYTEADLAGKMNSLLSEPTDYLILVPSSREAARRMHDLGREAAVAASRASATRAASSAIGSATGAAGAVPNAVPRAVSNAVPRVGSSVASAVASAVPRLLFADVGYLATPDATLEGMEGVVQIEDPQSGFHLAYPSRYGLPAGYGSAHFYDAALVAGLGILEADLSGETDLNAAIRRVVSAEGPDINGCTDAGVERLVAERIAGGSPHATGASGKLRFDTGSYTNVLHSVFCHWIVYQGEHLILEYTTSDDDNRTASSVVNWNWKVSDMQNFSEETSHTYPGRRGLYALIVASSRGWENYRHQADAYAFYQRLKAAGLRDDRILLVAEDDIAFDTRNLYPGMVHIVPAGENVYSGVKIDYHPSEISLETLGDLLTGETGSPVPLLSENDNLLVYWVGHADPEGPRWLDAKLSAAETGRFFRRLSEAGAFRKAFVLIETCYAGKIGEACEGIPGLLCITAAGSDETSKVNTYSYELRTWLSNSFTDALLDAFAHRPGDTLYALYSRIYNRTLGSHVGVYNADSFDNLYTHGFQEFLTP